MWLIYRYHRYHGKHGNRGKQILPQALFLSFFTPSSDSRWGRGRRTSALVSVDVKREEVEGFLGLGRKLALVVGCGDASLGVASDAPLEENKATVQLLTQARTSTPTEERVSSGSNQTTRTPSDRISFHFPPSALQCVFIITTY